MNSNICTYARVNMPMNGYKNVIGEICPYVGINIGIYNMTYMSMEIWGYVVREGGIPIYGYIYI